MFTDPRRDGRDVPFRTKHRTVILSACPAVTICINYYLVQKEVSRKKLRTEIISGYKLKLLEDNLTCQFSKSKMNKQTNKQNFNWFLSRVRDLLLTSLRVADLIS